MKRKTNERFTSVRQTQQVQTDKLTHRKADRLVYRKAGEKTRQEGTHTYTHTHTHT